MAPVPREEDTCPLAARIIVIILVSQLVAVGISLLYVGVCRLRQTQLSEIAELKAALLHLLETQESSTMAGECPEWLVMPKEKGDMAPTHGMSYDIVSPSHGMNYNNVPSSQGTSHDMDASSTKEGDDPWIQPSLGCSPVGRRIGHRRQNAVWILPSEASLLGDPEGSYTLAYEPRSGKSNQQGCWDGITE